MAGLAYHRSSDLVERVLATAREQLGMEVAFVSEFAGGQTVLRSLGGDAESFGFRKGAGTPLEDSFCRRVIEGLVPSVVPDAGRDEAVRDLGITRAAGIGSYVGVPLQFSDGRLYGTVCCMSHSPDPSLRERDAGFMGVLARLIAEQLEREELQWEKRRLELRAMGVGALLAALEARDGYTGEHSRAVVGLSVAVARRLGLPEEEVADVEQVALLHDVGKIGVPDSVLNKPGPLEAGERALMREHPAIGERIVASIEGLAHLAPFVRAEHERWDGGGYPDGLSGERIPLASRVVFACDAFHAMTSDRPYREAMGLREALEELRRNAGTQFCPGTVRALLDVVEPDRSDTRGFPTGG
ncbi:MAG: metal dependent phosphohydrolase [uncultured Rubrobacteraceae bacterium]|uniref:Metal dependent phosphohydrolase n=1 Tax=uncultured Rubrobacteraceae bacterium TaxID=349277 RepID=A0A6J4R4G4_9ACTN|nr:MAG: metal dependent phosphohydrolase [uncultured Rubrobacteraceae bacterium]